METIKVPAWALPICAAAISGAIAWGSMQASAQATNEEVERVTSHFLGKKRYKERQMHV